MTSRIYLPMFFLILSFPDCPTEDTLPTENAEYYENVTLKALEEAVRQALFSDKSCMELIQVQLSALYPEATSWTPTTVKGNASLQATQTIADICLYPVVVSGFRYRQTLRRIAMYSGEGFTNPRLHAGVNALGNASKEFAETLKSLRSLIYGLALRGDTEHARKMLGRFLHMVQSLLYRIWQSANNFDHEITKYLNGINPEVRQSLHLDKNSLDKHLRSGRPAFSASFDILTDFIWSTTVEDESSADETAQPNFKPIIRSRFLNLIGLMPPAIGILVDISCENDNRLDTTVGEYLETIQEMCTDFHQIVALRITTYANSVKHAAHLRVFYDSRGYSMFRGSLKAMLRVGCSKEKAEEVKLTSLVEGFISFANTLEFHSPVLVLTEDGRATTDADRPLEMWRAFEALILRKGIQVDTVILSKNLDSNAYHQEKVFFFNISKSWGGAYFPVPVGTEKSAKIEQKVISTLGHSSLNRTSVFDQTVAFKDEKTVKFHFDPGVTTAGVHVHCAEDFTVLEKSAGLECSEGNRIVFCYRHQKSAQGESEIRLSARVQTSCYIQAMGTSALARPVVNFLEQTLGPRVNFDSNPFKIGRDFVLSFDRSGENNISKTNNCRVRKMPLDGKNQGYGFVPCSGSLSPISDQPYFLEINGSRTSGSFRQLIPTLIRAEGSSNLKIPEISLTFPGSTAKIDLFTGIHGSTISHTAVLDCQDGCLPMSTVYSNCSIRKNISTPLSCSLRNYEPLGGNNKIVLSGQNAVKDLCLFTAMENYKEFAYKCITVPITKTVSPAENGPEVDLPAVGTMEEVPANRECLEILKDDCTSIKWSRVIEGHYIEDINYHAHPPSSIAFSSADLTKALGKISISGNCCLRNITIFAVSKVSGFVRRLEFTVNWHITDQEQPTGLTTLHIILIAVGVLLLVVFLVFLVLCVVCLRKKRRAARERENRLKAATQTPIINTITMPLPDLMPDDRLLIGGSLRRGGRKEIRV